MKNTLSSAQQTLRDMINNKAELSALTGSIRHGVTLSMLIDALEDMKITDPKLISGLQRAAGSRLKQPLKTSTADKLAASMLGYGRTNHMFAELKDNSLWQCTTVGTQAVYKANSGIKFYAPMDIHLTEADMDMLYGGGLWDIYADENERFKVLNQINATNFPENPPPGTFVMKTRDAAAMHFHFNGFTCPSSEMVELVEALTMEMNELEKEYDKHLYRCHFHHIRAEQLSSVTEAKNALLACVEETIGILTTYQAENHQLYVIDFERAGDGNVAIHQVIGFPQTMITDSRFSAVVGANR